MKIRKMQAKDIKRVYKVGIQVEGFAVSNESRFYSRKHFENWVKNGDDVLLVAEENGRIIGFFMSQFHKHTGGVIISNTYVDEQYQRKGVGKGLIKEGLKQLKRRKASYVYAQVKIKNPKVIKFLESLGFNKGYDFTWMETVL